jgi:hypothetical protein
LSLVNVESGLFAGKNTQATKSSAKNARSESAIAVNPKNPSNMIGASKKFTDPAKYQFILGPIYTFDGGKTWHESTLPLKSGWDGMTDPTVAFDNFGNAFLVGEPLKFGADLTGLGMVVYRSSDGGKTWKAPIQLTTATNDDKQWVLCDNNPASPHHGNVYVAWSASSPLRFARSTDHGASWKGKGSDPPGSSLVSLAFAPEISVSTDGTLHIFWHTDASKTIQYLRSTDGGATFDPVRVIVDDVHSLRGNLPQTNSWPHFENAKFRVITIATSCTGHGGIVVVAWADMREGRSRIYYRRSVDKGVTWEGPSGGQALLPAGNFGDKHCFHPQVVATTADGVVGCSFYTFGQWQPNAYGIHVQLAGSWDGAKTFSETITVTDQPWNPLLDAPFSHGDPAVHFIGDYFGLDAGEGDFALLWTDTRTGVQELFSDTVATERVTGGRHLPIIVAQILVGVAEDGGGWVIIGGKLVRIPPRSPLVAVAKSLAAVEAPSLVEATTMVRGALRELEAQALHGT